MIQGKYWQLTCGEGSIWESLIEFALFNNPDNSPKLNMFISYFLPVKFQKWEWEYQTTWVKNLCANGFCYKVSLYLPEKKRKPPLLHLDISFSLHLIFCEWTVVSGISPAACFQCEVKGKKWESVTSLELMFLDPVPSVYFESRMLCFLNFKGNLVGFNEYASKSIWYYIPLSWPWLLETLWVSEVHSVLSTTALHSSCTLTTPVASCMGSAHLRVLLLFPCGLLFSPAVLSSPKNAAFSWCAQCRTASVWSLLPPAIFQA